MKLYLNAFNKIWKDILFKIAGTLFPFYIGAVILYFIQREDIGKVFDPQSFILYSSTFLFSTLYMWYKTINPKRNEIMSLLLLLLIAIIISLLYSFSLIETLKQDVDSKMWSYLIFFVTLLTYILYECKTYLFKDKTKFYKETASEFNSLETSFDNFDEDGK